MNGCLRGWVVGGLALALACDHYIHRAHRLCGGGIKCSHVCACQKKKETEQTKKKAGDTTKKSEFTEAQKNDCRDLRTTFVHAYTKYANGALRTFTEKVNAMGKGHKYSGYSDSDSYENMLTTRGGDPKCREPDYACGKTKIRSKNSRYTLELACDGNLVLLNKLGQIKWQTESQCEDGYDVSHSRTSLTQIVDQTL